MALQINDGASSSSTPQFIYDVFLSFRGEYTRYNFTSHLYQALCDKGFNTFIDNDLQRGEEISMELFKAIELSMISIVVFSENYASSSWCLDELAHIVKCKNEIGLEVVPVFYHVNPSDVRHKECFKDCPEKVETWRDALREVANLSGWDLQDRYTFPNKCISFNISAPFF